MFARKLTRPAIRLWWSSLPLRVVTTTLAASSLVVLLGGLMLDRLVVDGLLQAKRTSALTEARTAFEVAQAGMNDPSMPSGGIDQKLIQVAKNAANRGSVTDQYDVIVQGRSAQIKLSRLLDNDPVPDELRERVSTPRLLYWTYTKIAYVAKERPDTPGLVVGALLESVQGPGTYPIYFVFPLTNEVKNIDVLRRAMGAVGFLLVFALGVVAYLVSRTVVTPVRRAAAAAGRMATGQLDERLPVRGSDDLAKLGESLNSMAHDLNQQISSYEELSRVQQQFVSDVSHELRTPLTTVRMAADMIYENRTEHNIVSQRSAELLHNELERFDMLLGDLLEISRFDAGAALLTADDTDIAEVIKQEIEVQTAFAARLNTRLILDARGDLTAQVDGRRVQRILRNLLTNAIEHCEARPIEITARGDDNSVAITVRDYGVGFEPDQADQVFRRFWRADPARARTIGGTGLGLAIAQEDATLHGGKIDAWGRPHRGAQFRLTLPRKVGEHFSRSPLPLVPVGEKR